MMKEEEYLDKMYGYKASDLELSPEFDDLVMSKINQVELIDEVQVSNGTFSTLFIVNVLLILLLVFDESHTQIVNGLYSNILSFI